jgi:hypothetical protein
VAGILRILVFGTMQMNRYPRLREETERIITTYIREKEQACKAGGGHHRTNPQFKGTVVRIDPHSLCAVMHPGGISKLERNPDFVFLFNAYQGLFLSRTKKNQY